MDQRNQKLKDLEKVRAWQERNPAKVKKASRDFYGKNRVRLQCERYGIGFATYQQMLDRQGGVCGICGESFGGSLPHVDHCHVTGRFRGLLHKKCNSGIGMLGDTVRGLEKALTYLKNA